MDKDKQIRRYFWVRHGYSEGNLDSGNYKLHGDMNIGLTQQGFEQAHACGLFLKAYFEKHATANGSRPRLWTSTFNRAAQTGDQIYDAASGLFLPADYRRDDALVEQNFGILSHYESEEEAIAALGPTAEFLYETRKRERPTAQFPMGESQLNVQGRVKPFYATLHRDWDKKDITDNVLVSHGATMRIGIMSFMHFPLAQIKEQQPDGSLIEFPNPNNCDVLMIEGSVADGYNLYKIYDGKEMRATEKIDLVEAYGLHREAIKKPIPVGIDLSNLSEPSLDAL